MEEDHNSIEDRAETSEAETKPRVLELSHVTFRAPSENGIRLRSADLLLQQGELAVVQLESSTKTRGFTSMIQGLIPPGGGRVRFCDQDWLGNDYERHFKMRSRIGRVFEGQAWIENLNVDENVTLSRRHHGADPGSIDRDVRYWLSKLEIKAISRKRPAFVEPSILQVHQWIRAFLGWPALLILERPLQFVSSEWSPRLVGAINELRSRGTAVLWLTSGPPPVALGLAEPWTHLKWANELFTPMVGGSQSE